MAIQELSLIETPRSFVQVGMRKVLVLYEVACSNLTEAKYFKRWGRWKVCSVVSFKTTELIEVRTSWPKHPVIKKNNDKNFSHVVVQVIVH